MCADFLYYKNLFIISLGSSIPMPEAIRLTRERGPTPGRPRPRALVHMRAQPQAAYVHVDEAILPEILGSGSRSSMHKLPYGIRIGKLYLP